MKTFLVRLQSNRRGQDMVEYALIAAFVASCVVALSPAILATSNYFNNVTALLSTAIQQTASN